jgi:hypothetical protein
MLVKNTGRKTEGTLTISGKAVVAKNRHHLKSVRSEPCLVFLFQRDDDNLSRFERSTLVSLLYDPRSLGIA